MPETPDSRGIDDLLTELGFRERWNRERARAAVEDAGLTRAGKQRIAAGKIPLVRRILAARFAVACSDPACQAEARRPGRTVVGAAERGDCWVCRGVPNRAGVDRAVAALLEAGLGKLAVVGGSPATRRELRNVVSGSLDLRLVEGTTRRTGREARGDIHWADLVVVWGSTQLDHKVSTLYTGVGDRRVVVCARRGLAALGETLVDAARGRRCSRSAASQRAAGARGPGSVG